jgi:alpha-D-xyloside xylohydrolase
MMQIRCGSMFWILATALVLALGACGGGGSGDAAGDPGADGMPDILPDVPVGDLPGELPADVDEVAPDVVDPGPESVALAVGGHGVTVDRVALTVTLTRGGQPVLVLDAAGIQMGRVDEIDDATSYDPYLIAAQVPGYDPPWGFAWLDVTAMAIGAHDQDSATVRLTYGTAKMATLTIAVPAAGRVRLMLTPDAAGDPVAYMRIRPIVDATEAFYGLGAYLDQVNHRGKIRAMQLEAVGNLESGYNEAHVPVPLVIGTRGWGLFVASRYPGSFDVAATTADRVDAAFGVGAAAGQGLEFHLFSAEKPIDVTKLYYDVTGAPLLPARWALGPWIWRNEIAGQVEVDADLQKIRDLDLATTAYWIDRPYANGVNSFDFHKDRYADPQAMIDRAHDLGFRMGLWHTPYVSSKDERSPETEVLLAEAIDKGYHPPTVGLILNKWGAPIDLTNPDAYAWWQGLIHRYTDMGIEGFKLDYGEDIVPGLLGMRSEWKFHDGSDERTMHSLWKLLYHRVYAETMPADGGFLLCRAGTWGDQVNVSVIWPGDLDANMVRHGEAMPGEGKTFVGGLPASLAYDLNLGASGFPFYGADTGGYRESPPARETFMRWYQQTALSSVMQVGTGSSSVAWEFTNPDGGPDTELLDNYRVYTRLHLRLFPYEWTYAKQLSTTGRPITRALGLAYPEIGQHPSDTFLFGDDLLAAPVVTEGLRTRDVILPPGSWLHWWTGLRYEGGQTVTVDAPLTELPLFLRAGGIVPMLRPTIDAIAPTTHPDLVDSYATTPGILWARVFPGAESTFTLFDSTALTQSLTGGTLRLGYADGTEFAQGAVFEVVGFADGPTGVTEGGTALVQTADLAALEAATGGWFWDLASGTLFVKVPAGTHTVDVMLPIQ